jgi:hypothetical protein
MISTTMSCASIITTQELSIGHAVDLCAAWSVGTGYDYPIHLFTNLVMKTASVVLGAFSASPDISGESSNRIRTATLHGITKAKPRVSKRATRARWRSSINM